MTEKSEVGMGNLSQHIRSLVQSSTTPQTLIDIAEDVQELEAENARLNTELKLSKKDATFYKSLLDRWATGKQYGVDHIYLQQLAIKIDQIGDEHDDYTKPPTDAKGDE